MICVSFGLDSTGELAEACSYLLASCLATTEASHQKQNVTIDSAFLLLTPLFFPEFLGSNDKGMAARAYIGGRDPVAPGVGDSPLSFFSAMDLVANLKKKNYT